MTNEELKVKLMEYDLKHGEYPESQYEGYSLYMYLTGKTALEYQTVQNFKRWELDMVNHKWSGNKTLRNG